MRLDRLYNIWHQNEGIYDFWGEKDYEKIGEKLTATYRERFSIKISDREMVIRILDKKGKGKKMPQKVREYLSSKGLKIMDIVRIEGGTKDQLSKIEHEYMKKGKIPLPIGTYNGYCEIRFVDDPFAN